MRTVRWALLSTSVNHLLGTPVEIVGSTGQAMGRYRGLVHRGPDGSIIIAVNLNLASTVDEIIAVLAHEVAHIVLNSPDHSREHRATARRIAKTLREEYDEGVRRAHNS